VGRDHSVTHDAERPVPEPGGADLSAGSGLRGLADRVEALDRRFGVESPPAAGTRVWAEIPVAAG